jgi:hypothetical protein
MRNLTLFLALAATCLPSVAREKFAFEALKQIQAQLGDSCAVEPIESKLTLIGNNGFRIERWQVNTCSGPAEYDVRYYPPEFFPNRDSAFSVQRVTSGGTRPNNSFKPKPLRGSA